MACCFFLAPLLAFLVFADHCFSLSRCQIPQRFFSVTAGYLLGWFFSPSETQNWNFSFPKKHQLECFCFVSECNARFTLYFILQFPSLQQRLLEMMVCKDISNQRHSSLFGDIFARKNSSPFSNSLQRLIMQMPTEHGKKMWLWAFFHFLRNSCAHMFFSGERKSKCKMGKRPSL